MNRKKEFTIIRFILSICGAVVGGLIVSISYFDNQHKDILTLLIGILVGAVIGFGIIWILVKLLYWRYKWPYNSAWKQFRKGLESQKMKSDKNKR